MLLLNKLFEYLFIHIDEYVTVCLINVSLTFNDIFNANSKIQRNHYQSLTLKIKINKYNFQQFFSTDTIILEITK